MHVWGDWTDRCDPCLTRRKVAPTVVVIHCFDGHCIEVVTPRFKKKFPGKFFPDRRDFRDRKVKKCCCDWSDTSGDIC